MKDRAPMTQALLALFLVAATIGPVTAADPTADTMLSSIQSQVQKATTFEAKVEAACRGAEQLMVRGKGEEARALLAQVGAGKADPRLIVLAARSYLTWPPTSPDEAMQVLKPFLLKAPRHPDGLLEWARALRESREYPGAVKTYDILLRYYPKDLRAHYGKIDTFMAQRKFKEAEAAARAALVLDDKRAETSYYLGRVFERRDDVPGPKETAVSHYRRAVDLGGGETRYFAPLMFAQMMYGAGDYKETLDRLRKVAPGDASVAFGEGLILDSEAKLPEAVAKFQGALAIDPGHTFAHFALGTLYTGHSLSRVFLGSGRHRDERRASVANPQGAFQEYATVRLQDPTFPFMFVIDDYQSRMQNYQPQRMTPELVEQQKAWQKYWLNLQLRH